MEIEYNAGISSTKLLHAVRKVGTTPGMSLNRLRRLIRTKPIVSFLEAPNGMNFLRAEQTKVKD